VSVTEKVAIAVQNRARGLLVPEAKLMRLWIRSAVGGNRRGEVVLRIVGRAEGAELNRRYRKREGATNVLAFPAAAEFSHVGEDPPPLGDLVVCAEVLEREAREQGKSLDQHWAHVLIHGALHLIGYDHETADGAQAMEARERELLAGFGFDDPYA
jgi:probable rRNA maturation factor